MTNFTYSQSPAATAGLCVAWRWSMRSPGGPVPGGAFGAPHAVRRAIPI
jgi:hypothetical protein